MKDYKKEFVALLNEMHKDNNDGLIPIMIAEGLYECDANKDFLEYWVCQHIYKKFTAQLKINLEMSKIFLTFVSAKEKTAIMPQNQKTNKNEEI